MRYGYWNEWTGWHMWFSVVLFVVLIVVIIKLLQPKAKGDEMSAKQILDKRYAKGEIDKEEYERIKNDLSR